MFFRALFTVKRIFLILVVLLLTGIVAGVILRKPPPPGYQTAVAEFSDLEDAVQSAGVLQPEKRVDVGAQVNGQLQKLYVKLGQGVKKGDLLATIDPQIAQNDVLNQEALLEQVTAQRDAKHIELEQAWREAARQKTLLAGDATAKTDAEQATTKALTLEGDTRALSAQMRQTQTNLKSAHTRLGYTQIHAPMDGDVVFIAAQEGQTLIATQMAPAVLTLAKLDTMTVRAQVAEADVNRLRIGQKIYFTTLGNEEQRYSGTLRTIQPLPEKINNAVFFNALFDVPNTNRALWTDMTVQVTVVLSEQRHVLTIPMLALGTKDKDGRFEVRVLNDDKTVTRRRIRTGLDDHIKVQVLDGLKAGERVITGEGAIVAGKA